MTRPNVNFSTYGNVSVDHAAHVVAAGGDHELRVLVPSGGFVAIAWMSEGAAVATALELNGAMAEWSDLAAEAPRYNGWKNYETWVTALWIDNEQGSYSVSREIVNACFEDEEDEAPRVTAVDALRDWAQTNFISPSHEEDGTDSGLAVDLLGHAFGQVDWFEIVDAIRAES